MKIFAIRYSSIFLLLLLVNCKENTEVIINHKASLYKVIDLNPAVDNNIVFDETLTDFPVYTIKKKYPDYYNQKFKGALPNTKLDSFVIVSKNFQREPFLWELYKIGTIEKDQILKILNIKSFDTSRQENKNLKYQLNVLSGFKENNQIIIPDLNNNGKFDDTIFVSERNFRNEHHNSQKIINNLPLSDFSYEVKIDGEIFRMNRKIQLYPYSNSMHTYHHLSTGTLDEALNDYTLMLRIRDYRRGTLEVNNSKYKVSVQGLSSEFYQIMIIPDNTLPQTTASSHHANFSYQIKDSINLGGQIFQVDSLNGNLSKLFLKKLDLVAEKFRGHRIGEKINDYILQDIDKINSRLSDVASNEKGYTLLDFWGTWCIPCIKNLPELKALHSKYADNVNFISIAYDDDIQQVKRFTIKNNLDWPHFFVDRGNTEGTIVSGLKVASYPTFILLDRDFKIIHRGGTSSFIELENTLENLFK